MQNSDQPSDDTPLSARFEKVLFDFSVLVEKWRRRIALAEQKPVLKDLCLLWLSLSAMYEELDAKRKEMYELLDHLDKKILPAEFEKAELDKISVPEVSRSFYPNTKYSAKILDKEAAFKWLRSNKLKALITETVNAQTLTATLKARLLDENKEPPASMELKSYKTIGSSKYQPK